MKPEEASRIRDSLVRGVVQEVLPKAMCRVRLQDGRTVRAGLRTTCRHGIVRFIVGCQVEVKLSPRDPSRGQIIRKL